jgi:two-component system CheB/CheR fusion protein
MKMSTTLNDGTQSAANESPPVQFVVGVGASAGGIRSIEKMLRSLEQHPTSAFIIVQHMSPDANSSMSEILARYTAMDVVSVEQQMRLQPNTIYLIPPAKEIRLNGNMFEVTSLDREQIARPIDTFFRSLAESHGDRAIGVVLSGTGSDGTEGIELIHRMGGTTIAESLDSAQFDGMPRNAMATDCINLVMTPGEIGSWLNKQFQSPDERPSHPGILGDLELSGINLIFSLLSEGYDIEFSFYKPATVARRIERRQVANNKKTILEYAEFLRGNMPELDALYHDLLIGVTKFFRDTDAFRRLEKELHQKIKALPEKEEFRVWVAGCATGEEAYSIGMICREAFEFSGKEPNFKIFATDAHGGSLDHASKGIYHVDSLEFVAIDRQQKFFARESDDTLRVNTDLRRHLVFARHNVVQDPPFTKMDLVTCRNLLIYLKTEAQLKSISSFHFALKRDGIMMLGASESPGKLSDEFEVVDEAWKMYRKLRDMPSPYRALSGKQRKTMAQPRKLVNLLNSDRPETLSFTGLIEGYDLILSEFVDSGLLLDDQRNVLHVFGDANKYLTSSSGRFTGNIMGFLSGDVKVAIAAALIRAKKDIGKQIVLEDLAIPVTEGEAELADVFVKAIDGHSKGSFVWFLTFVSKPNLVANAPTPEENTIKVNLSSDAYAAMEAELIYTKESLSATIEQVETSNEQMQSTNEQLIAANEELQSTNEELHSVNEELYSVNAENQRKIGDLEEMTDDVDNLLSSTDIGIIFLNSEMQVRKFTNAASNYIKLQTADIGREITDFAMHVKTPDLYGRVQEVIQTGDPYSTLATTKTNLPVLIRVTPYWSNRAVKGAILNFIEMSEEAYAVGEK